MGSQRFMGVSCAYIGDLSPHEFSNYKECDIEAREETQDLSGHSCMLWSNDKRTGMPRNEKLIKSRMNDKILHFYSRVMTTLHHQQN